MDDLSFFNTEDEVFRGGIWDHTVRPDRPDRPMDVQSPTSLYPPDAEGSPGLEATEILDSPVPASPITPQRASTSTSSTSLRHHKTTPDLRNSSPTNLTTIADSPNRQPFPKPYLKESFSSTDSLADDSQPKSSFDINEHIGELSSTRTLDSKAGPISDTKATIVETVKKWGWGNWYSKDRRNNNANTEEVKEAPALPPRRDVSSESLRRKSTPVLPSKLNRKLSAKTGSSTSRHKERLLESNKPISAPIPHSFPPELMDAISSDQPNFPDVINNETINERAKPVPPVSRSKSMKESRRKSQSDWELRHEGDKIRKERKSVSKASVKPTEDDPKHHVNPSLKLLRKPTAAAAITIPSAVDADSSGTSPSKSIRIPKSRNNSNVSSVSSSTSSSKSFNRGSYMAKRERTESRETNDIQEGKEPWEVKESKEVKNVDFEVKPEPKVEESDNDTVFDMDGTNADIESLASKTSASTIHHHVKRKAVGSGPRAHFKPRSIHQEDLDSIITATDDAPLTAPVLDKAPTELASSDFMPMTGPFAAPVLAPPPLARRGSNENLRRSGETRTSPYAPVGETQHPGSVIAVPMPVSTAKSYTHDRSNFGDFLSESTSKFESASHLDQRDQPQQKEYSTSAHSASLAHKPSAHRSSTIKRKPTTSMNHHQQTAPDSPTPTTSTLPSEEQQPILSYRKGKSKQNQGFKFF